MRCGMRAAGCGKQDAKFIILPVVHLGFFETQRLWSNGIFANRYLFVTMKLRRSDPFVEYQRIIKKSSVGATSLFPQNQKKLPENPEALICSLQFF